MTKLPHISFKIAGDEFLHRHSTIPCLDGDPIPPGVIIEHRCTIDAQLEGLVYPGHNEWCHFGKETVAAIGWGHYPHTNGMRGPRLQAVVAKFQWAPPIHYSNDIWVDRHCEPNELCHLGMATTNWRATVIEPWKKKSLDDNMKDWLAKHLAERPNVSVIDDIGHPSIGFYEYWNRELFGDGINEDYQEVTGHHKPEHPIRRKYIAVDTLLCPLREQYNAVSMGLGVFSVALTKEEAKVVDYHTAPISGEKYNLGSVQIGDWVAFPADRYGVMPIGDRWFAIVGGEDFYLFNPKENITFSKLWSYWGLSFPREIPASD
jgi:hypothetical protein